MQLYFLSFCDFQPLFLGSSGKNLWLLLKSNSLFSKFCVNCLLMFYFVYCNNCALLPMFVHLPFQQILIDFRQDCITCDAGNFTCSLQLKRPHVQYTCVTCSLPVKTGNYTGFYAARTSRRIHAISVNKARKLQVTSPAWCRLTNLKFAGEFTRGVMADCLQLQVILRGVACDCGGLFSCVCS